MLDRLVPWQQRVGFVDAYGGPLYGALNTPLKTLDDDGLNRVLRDFEDWRDPAVRHGIVPRLLEAAGNYVRRGDANARR